VGGVPDPVGAGVVVGVEPPVGGLGEGEVVGGVPEVGAEGAGETGTNPSAFFFDF
jgi:hypothetical protein